MVEQRDYSGALLQLQKALRLRPEYPDALASVGECMIATRRVDAAESAVRRALQLDAGHVAARYQLARVLQHRGQQAPVWTPSISARRSFTLN